MRILHIINDFSTGGTQRFLANLILEDIKINNNQHHVLILKISNDSLINVLIENDIKFHYLYDGRIKLLKSFRFCKTFKPEILQTWLYISDLYGLFLKLFFHKSKLFWNIRNGMPNKSNISSLSWFSARLSCLFSFIPNKIISPSEKSINEHIIFGFNRNKFILIPNFINSKYILLYNDNSLINRSKNDFVTYGIVSRFDKQKGIDTLLLAINNLPKNLKIKFIFIGTGLNDINLKYLLKQLDIVKLNYDILFENKSENLFEFYTKIDFHISSSNSEAFPNAVMESMYFGKPNIVTNTGDSRKILSNFGYVLNTKDYQKLSDYIFSTMNLYFDNFISYKKLSYSCHKHIASNYSLTNTLYKYNLDWKNS